MAECTSGDLTVLVLDNTETQILITALKHLWKDDNECLILANDWERGALHSVMDAIGVD